MMAPLLLLATLLLAASSLARDVPDNVRNLYDSIREKGMCSIELAGGFYSSDDGPNTFSYCGDHLEDYKIVYIQGTGGVLANMDVDCDGAQGGPANDGRCASSRDTQAVSSFQSTVASYGRGIRDLDANIHPYIVFGNEGSKPGWKTFDPQEVGIQPLSLMAVVCGDKLIYGVWGDTNGDDGPHPMVGEAAISVATECFGTEISGDSGYDQDDVLYIAFVGQDAVPGAKGANWTAADYQTFSDSIRELGDKLIDRIGINDDESVGSVVMSRGRSALLPLAVTLAAGWLVM
ncbi:hypothetical protein jhhlp_007939 [Lomentospora prolificans]|uniref:Endo-chitosanase n=1 Tax=Lomentospora prolificans TaxID=41688 RepID=A0A2N3N110_9PEZI|nr:hypothetical protein jhhlp_007939 [Lomentospora prolificans]